MANLPSDLLGEARRCIGRADGMPEIPEREAIVRSAIHLAYYAAYHAGLNRANRDGLLLADQPAGMGSHERLWGWWFEGQRGRRDVARLGAELKEARVLADYRLGRTVTHGLASYVVTEAERLIGLLRT